MADERQARTAGVGGQMVTFRLDGDLYGIDVSNVQEVLRAQRITPVPLAPVAVAGLINLRGQVVTAIDLRGRLGRPPSPEGVDSVAVVVRLNGETVGLLVDSINDVTTVRPGDFEPPPETLEGDVRSLIRGAYKLERELLLALDVRKVVDLSVAAGQP